ncbi:hypothetical protein [Rubellimicrobium arenae]|uniref:hypothetical protein n=1 Tax=Rubellimicrobium arenae TaxID=2817372 RepID=UPI001B30B835|nr:hypothetical protein [Rubellimicrobium arenae]
MDLIHRLLDRLLVGLLALALAASGGMAMTPGLTATKDGGMASDQVPANCGTSVAAMQGMPTGHGALGRHDAHGAGAGKGPDGAPDHHRHGPSHCSICLIAGAFVDMPGLVLPPLAMVWHPLGWIGPGLRAPPETHARAPPARGPPALVL